MNDTQPHVQAVVGVSGFRVESAGMGVSGERFIKIDLPSTFTDEHITRMQRDLVHMAQLAQQYPKDMVELGNAAARHDFHTAGAVARRIGLTEAEFVARGGGTSRRRGRNHRCFGCCDVNHGRWSNRGAGPTTNTDTAHNRSRWWTPARWGSAKLITQATNLQ